MFVGMLRLCPRLVSTITTSARLLSSQNKPPIIDAKVISRKKTPYKSTKSQLLRKKEKRAQALDVLLNEPDIAEGHELLEQSLIKDNINRNTAEELSLTHKKARSRIKYAIWKKKYMKEAPQIGVLTWAAKEQIHYLHNTDPEKWSFEELSENFPITPIGIKKLLHNTYNLYSMNEVIQHDKRVLSKWQNVISNEDFDSLPEGYKWLFSEHKSHLIVFANGNPNLPSSPQSYIKIMEEKERCRITGPYESIVTSFYANLAANSKSTESNQESDALYKEICSFIDLIRESAYSGSPSDRSDVTTTENHTSSDSTESQMDSTDLLQTEFDRFLKIFTAETSVDNHQGKKKKLELNNSVMLDFSRKFLYKETI